MLSNLWPGESKSPVSIKIRIFDSNRFRSVTIRLIASSPPPTHRDAEEKIVQSLERIITIWSERNLYDPKLLNEFRMNLKNGSGNLSAVGGTPSSVHSSQSEKVKKRKEKVDEPVDGSPSKKIKPVLLSHTDAELPVKGEDVDSKDLVNCLRSLENTASCDAAIRERIAKLPPEVSDASYIDKLRDKNEAEQLSLRVDDACVMLSDYNGRLAKELEDRKKISHKLAAFCRYQRELQEQIQKTLTEYAERLRKVKQVRTELKLHLLNLPDLDKLPSLNEAPLPKPSDLFLSSSNPTTKREDEKSNDSIGNDSIGNDSGANDAHDQNGLRPGADESARSEESARGNESSRGDELSRDDEPVRGDESVPGADQTDRLDGEFQRSEPAYKTTKSAVSA